jgi:probable F420-dependent oxidoreductase
VRIGLALPQYDYSVPGEDPLRWETIARVAQRAEALGFDSVWLSDHLFLDLAKYGGSSRRFGAFEPIVTLAALSRVTHRVRLGTLVLCEALRPATVLAKALASLDAVSGGRLDVGLGAGWYEPEYEAIAMKMPGPGERLLRLAEVLDVLRGLLGGGPFTYTGTWQQATAARNLPPAVQAPHPPLIVGGKGDRLLALAAEKADGWNTCWSWTPDDYAARAAVLDAACERIGRDPATITRTLGLTTLVGDSDADVARRFDRWRATGPPGVLDGQELDDWRGGRLVGTVEEVREQVAGWARLGVAEIIVGLGPVPFSLIAEDDIEALVEALVPAASKIREGTLD